MLISTVFNVLAFLSFFGLVSAVLFAIHRGMGVHVEIIRNERGSTGVTAYKQVSPLKAILNNRGKQLLLLPSFLILGADHRS